MEQWADLNYSQFASRRSTVHSTQGIVACTQALAATAGQRILQQGGNAADAAVATAAALNVTEPTSTGIGGDIFCLYYDAKAKKVFALNGSGRAPANIDIKTVRKELGASPEDTIPPSSVHSVTVPGAAAGWIDIVERFGSGKLTMADVLAPAIELAERGFPVSELTSKLWAQQEQFLRDASPNYSEMLKPDPSAKDGVRSPRAGELFRNPNLANTMRKLAKEGKPGFYGGSVADAIIEVTKPHGSYLTLDDLKDHMKRGSEPVDPISIDVPHPTDPNAAVRVWEHPPNGQGIIALIALGILQVLERKGQIRPLDKLQHNSAEYLHIIISCLEIAFADGAWWVADPNCVNIPDLLNPSYLESRAELFNPNAAPTGLSHGSPALRSSDTIYLATSDGDGNAVSFINSNYNGFGSGIIPKGCGFTLQNRGSNFSLQDGHPNVLAPHKRPYHTIIPAMVTNVADDTLNMSFGVMGGFMQPQGHVQVLLNMHVFRQSPQAALDAPRICIAAGPEIPDGVMVHVEEGIASDVVDDLRKKGHNVEIVRDYHRMMFGRGQVIRCHIEDGTFVYSAGSDPRGDGAALPV